MFSFISWVVRREGRGKSLFYSLYRNVTEIEMDNFPFYNTFTIGVCRVLALRGGAKDFGDPPAAGCVGIRSGCSSAHGSTKKARARRAFFVLVNVA